MTNFMLYIFYHSQKGKHQESKTETETEMETENEREGGKGRECFMAERTMHSYMVTTGLLTKRGEETFLDFYRFGHREFFQVCSSNLDSSPWRKV